MLHLHWPCVSWPINLCSLAGRRRDPAALAERLAGALARLLPAEELARLLEVDIDDGRDVERQQLRGEQAADDAEAERAAQLRAGAEAERDRQRPHDRRHRRHHDRAE